MAAPRIVGYASVFGKEYDMGWYSERVAPGAFTKTLSEKPQTHLLVNHSGLPLASTVNGSLVLTADQVGLRFDAQLDPEDSDSQAVVRKVNAGLMQEASFAFVAVKQAWSDDWTQRTIQEASLNHGDVSVVNFGASPWTSVAVDGEADDPTMSAVASRRAPMSLEERRHAAQVIGKRFVGGVRQLSVAGVVVEPIASRDDQRAAAARSLRQQIDRQRSRDQIALAHARLGLAILHGAQLSASNASRAASNSPWHSEARRIRVFSSLSARSPRLRRPDPTTAQ